MWCVWFYFNQERSKKEYAWVCVSFLLVTANGLFQVVHRIQRWMARKLSSHYKRDTECLNHSTWMMICMRLLYCCDFMTPVMLWCSAARMISFLILNLFYFYLFLAPLRFNYKKKTWKVYRIFLYLKIAQISSSCRYILECALQIKVYSNWRLSESVLPIPRYQWAIRDWLHSLHSWLHSMI